MCGISGFVVWSEKGSQIAHHLFKMNDILKHRGGDDEGYVFFSKDTFTELSGDRTPTEVLNSNPHLQHRSTIEKFGNVGLSHNRLSILDASEKGHQPMSDQNELFWITFNGEIYNFIAIREELKQLGHLFYSNTDTEVVLKSYMEWGSECVQKFNGMWAFAVYDITKEVLFLSRDRFGVKPLYYRLEDDFLCFASELKALYHIKGCQNELNPQEVFNYLTMGLVEGSSEGMVKNVFELKPAHNLLIEMNDKSLEPYSYYTLDFTKKWESFSKLKAEEYANELECLIRKSVERRLQSDVQVGSCLSGGVDSSVVVGFVNQLFEEGEIESIGELQKVFTSCFKNEDVDEEKWAKIVVDSTDTEWHKTYPSSADFINDFKDLVYYQDVPFFGSSTYAQYRVMKLVNEKGIKVTLDGQGADELFTGYSEFNASYLCNALKALDLPPLVSSFSPSHLSFPMKFYAAKCLPNSIFEHQVKRQNMEFSYINSSLWNENKKELHKLKNNFDSNLNTFLHFHFTGEKFKNLLRTADRNSMRFSVESRMPFADDIDLIEHVFSISASYKIRKKTSKYLLREAAKSVLPKAIYERKDKIGFAAPEQRWFKEQMNALLAFIPMENDEFVNWKELRGNWTAIINHAQQSSTIKLWRFINFAVWRSVHKL